MILLGKRVVFKLPDEKEAKTKSGLVLIKSIDSPYVIGEIIEFGAEVKIKISDSHGNPRTKVLINKGGINEFEWNGEKCYVVDEEMVLGVE